MPPLLLLPPRLHLLLALLTLRQPQMLLLPLPVLLVLLLPLPRPQVLLLLPLLQLHLQTTLHLQLPHCARHPQQHRRRLWPDQTAMQRPAHCRPLHCRQWPDEAALLQRPYFRLQGLA